MSSNTNELRIAVFGAVNTGKSSIVNALVGDTVAAVSARGGHTRCVTMHYLDLVEYRGIHGDQVVVVLDTPGLSEAGDAVNAALAWEAVKSVDLVLFILADDINEAEMTALRRLQDQGKPVLAVLNKIDKRQRENELAELRYSLLRRIEPLVGQANIVETAAAPFHRLNVADASGSVGDVGAPDPPDIDLLIRRIAEIIRSEGRSLKQISRLLQEADRLRDEREGRRKTAMQRVEIYAGGVALGVAVNPIPLFDFVGGAAAIGTLAKQVADVYGMTFEDMASQKFVSELWQQARKQLMWSVGVIVGGSVMKAAFGLGTTAGAVIQAGAVGYFTYVVGSAIVAYFDNGMSWNPGGAEQTLREIISSLDKNAVTNRIVAHVKARIGVK
jgi:small GTP-binding protein